MNTGAAAELMRFLDGEEAAAWLRAGIRAWLAGESQSIQEGLGLPATARAASLALRNVWLIEAARQVLAPSAWLHARGLEAEVRAFSAKWAAWCRLSAPPSYATAVQRCLFRAAQHGELPKTAERMLAILNEALYRERLVTSARTSDIATKTKCRGFER